MEKTYRITHYGRCGLCRVAVGFHRTDSGEEAALVLGWNRWWQRALNAQSMAMMAVNFAARLAGRGSLMEPRLTILGKIHEQQITGEAVHQGMAKLPD